MTRRAVKFDYDTRPTKLGMLTVVYPPYYLGEVKKEKSMRGIQLNMRAGSVLCCPV